MADASFLDWPFLDDGHRRFARALAPWAAANLAGLVDHHDIDGSCRRLVGAMGEAGWLAATVPAEHGGLHRTFDVRSLCLARETLAFHEGLADFAFAMQGLGAGPVTLFGTDGSSPAGCPASPGARRSRRSRSRSPRRGPTSPPCDHRARGRPGPRRIDGRKTWISNGGIADFYVVFARSGEAPGARGLSAFVVDAGTPGLESPSASR